MTTSTMTDSKLPASTSVQTPDTREAELHMTPAVDIYENEDGLTVVADMPGVRKEGIEVRVNDRILTLHGTVSLAERRSIIAKEYGMMNYFRQFRLGEEVDQEKISAKLEQGVLTIHMPKAEDAKPKRIEVEAK